MKTFKDVQLNFKKNNQYTPTNAKVVLDSKNTDLGQFTLSVSYGSFAYGKGRLDDTFEIALFENVDIFFETVNVLTYTIFHSIRLFINFFNHKMFKFTFIS